jgi:hypothetical protein
MVATLVLHYPYEFVSPCSSAQVHHALDIFYMDFHFDVLCLLRSIRSPCRCTSRAVLHRATTARANIIEAWVHEAPASTGRDDERRGALV